MDGSSKILTVSYGTFSCTLEGFDDPLGAMRDIAEYFRDLAADDRYFGAEPPTPDVEMLQSIAEKEVNRRVEARLSDQGVALRQVTQVSEPPVAAAPEPEPPAAAPEDDTDAMAARVVNAARAPDPAPEPKPAPKSADTGTGPLTFNDDFLMADEPEDVLAVDPDARPASERPAESVAEKLRRIRAVVSRNIDSPGPIDPEPEFDESPRSRAQTRTIADITADLSDDTETDGFEPILDVPEPEAPANAPAAPAAPAAPETTVEADADLPETETPKTESHLAEEPARPLSLTPEDFAPAEEASDPAPEEEESDEATARRISAIVGNVSAALEQEPADTPDPVDAADPALPRRPGTRVVTRPLGQDEDAHVGRLMEETDSKLNEDDVVRRRRVISQMRAAVAATKADRMVSRPLPREAQEEEDRSAYRDDLSQAVLPQNAAPEDRPTSGPPLVLVSSQRVDEEREDGLLHGEDLLEDFVEFAREMGAIELDELLEAAAAYTVFGRGQSSFTRPEIMKRVAAVDPTIRMSREESLRSFGQLLRTGTFRKLERGQFTIDQRTRFHPDLKAADA